MTQPPPPQGQPWQQPQGQPWQQPQGQQNPPQGQWQPQAQQAPQFTKNPTPMPPPPPPAGHFGAPTVAKAPPVAWLIPAAALLAVIGVFTPWFSPKGTLHGEQVLGAESDLYSWKDGRIGLVAPIILVIAGIGVFSLLRGKVVSRFEGKSHGPVVSAARSAMIVGVVSLVAAAIAWFLVPGQFDNVPADAGGSWDGAQRMGIDMSRGPQIGYWLTLLAGLLALVGGALMLATRDKSADAQREALAAGYRPPPPAPAQYQQQPAAQYGQLQYPPTQEAQYPQQQPTQYGQRQYPQAQQQPTQYGQQQYPQQQFPDGQQPPGH